MSAENRVFIVNQQALIQAAQEMERQEAFLSLMLLHCIDQLEDVRRKLDVVMDASAASRARDAFRNLFMSNEEWGRLMGEAQFTRWQEEFRAARGDLPS